jgi:hypothetical protein
MARRADTLGNPITWQRITSLKFALGTLAASCYGSSMSCYPVGSSLSTSTPPRGTPRDHFGRAEGVRRGTRTRIRGRVDGGRPGGCASHPAKPQRPRGATLGVRATAGVAYGGLN